MTANLSNIMVYVVCPILILISAYTSYKRGAHDGASHMIEGLVEEGLLVAFRNPKTGENDVTSSGTAMKDCPKCGFSVMEDEDGEEEEKAATA